MRVLQALHVAVWGPGLELLLLGTGLFLSVRCGFPQLRLRRVWRGTAGRLLHAPGQKPGHGLSPFQTLTTALAGTVGTGNIAGVTGAIFLGGPGAVFWMWVAAFFGMAAKYAEIALAVRYRETDAAGRPRGGPMLYIQRGLGPRFRPLAAAFALLGALASFGIGNLAQSSEIAGAARELFGAPLPVTGLALSLLVAAVLLGGAKSVGRATELLVPLMTGLYLLCALPVLLLHLGELPDLFRLIVRSAFSLRAAGGGAVGWTMREALRQGLARGVFSNEAGLGSAPVVHACAAGGRAAEEGLWGVFEVLIDTFVVCTLTALVVLLSGIWRGGADGLAARPSAGAAAAEAFGLLLPGFPAGTLIALCLLFFALSSVIGWALIGEMCWGWLFGGRRGAVLGFRLLFALLCPLGALSGGEIAWQLADTLNGMMAIPNLIALLLLSGRAAEIAKS